MLSIRASFVSLFVLVLSIEARASAQDSAVFSPPPAAPARTSAFDLPLPDASTLRFGLSIGPEWQKVYVDSETVYFDGWLLGGRAALGVRYVGARRLLARLDVAATAGRLHVTLADWHTNEAIVPVSVVAEPSLGFALPHVDLEVGARVGALFAEGESWLVAGGFLALGGRFGRENRGEVRVYAGGAVAQIVFTGLSLGWFFA